VGSERGIPRYQVCVCVVWCGVVGNYLQSLGQVVRALCAPRLIRLPGHLKPSHRIPSHPVAPPPPTTDILVVLALRLLL